MSTVIPTQIEKCKGAMLATAIGDALGWPNEPRSKNRSKKSKIVDHFVEWTRSSNYPRWHDEKILPGEYSDDTQMTLSVARSIIAGDWEKFLAEKELPFWLNYERGGGSALLKAAKSCKEGFLLWQSNNTRGYFNAGGNGATMRILPHVIAAAKTFNITGLMTDVVKDTLITHGHPRAFLGATCYAYALDYLLRKETVLEYGELVTVVIDGQNDWGANLNTDVFGEWLNIAQQHCGYDFFTEWEKTRDRMVRQLELISVSLKKGLILDDIKVLSDLECFGKANGAGDVAALAAIYLASKYANNPSLGIKVPAFSFGADTDTIASMAGGLLGMLSGTNWIPAEWKAVQDYDCLIQITELLLADNKKEATKEEVAEAKAQDNHWRTTPIGKVRFVESKSVPNGKYGIVIIEKWQNMLGQTMYTKDFKPNDMPQQINQPSMGSKKPHKTTLYDSEDWPKLSNEQQVANQQQSKMPEQEPTQAMLTPQKAKRQFVLESDEVTDLLGNPHFRNSITVGKVLKIIQALIDSNKESEDLAKEYRVEIEMVDIIKRFVKVKCR
ncbi:ADP-ribosylglycohydrolase family protein [Acetobacterium wieringae]|uniref:ADP-ribosylglycohydrolase family protein n=1 Tax=Acetobacterium wieringae TaxID=52694 RepID=A0A5D0WI63_9FIRM|nr:ADP-ribosylglycohydrolase family protein [Acetobacterium wieringae]TYC83920.1 ADP-ribosylglycohydrolase family protein [Acetobacterium wieringae]